MGRLKELPQYDFTLLLVGFFLAPVTSTYTFYTTSDDASYLWLESNEPNNFTFPKLLNPWTWSVDNAIVKNGGLHASATRYSNPISLQAGTYYPIYMVYGQLYGGADFQVKVEEKGGLKMNIFDKNWFNNAR